jgi:hypothetical protein
MIYHQPNFTFLSGGLLVSAINRTARNKYGFNAAAILLFYIRQKKVCPKNLCRFVSKVYYHISLVDHRLSIASTS